MNNIMEYKGHTGAVAFSAEDGCLLGRVLGIDDIISYEGESVAEIRKAFEESIDFYLEECLANGKEPNKPSSEALAARIESALPKSPDAEYDAFFKAKVEAGMKDIQEGQVFSNEDVEMEAALRKEELLARIALRR